MNYLSFRIWIHLSWTNWNSRLLLSVPTWKMWIWRKSISTTALRKNDFITTLMFLFLHSCHMGSKKFFSGLWHTPLLVFIPDVHVIFWMTNLLEIQLFLLWLSLQWASANKINLYLSLIETIESYLQSSFQLYTRYDLMHQQISKIFLWTISLVSMLVFTVSPFSESCKDCMDCLLSNCVKTVEIIVVRMWKGSFLRYNQCSTYLLTQKSD